MFYINQVTMGDSPDLSDKNCIKLRIVDYCTVALELLEQTTIA